MTKKHDESRNFRALTTAQLLIIQPYNSTYGDEKYQLLATLLQCIAPSYSQHRRYWLARWKL